MHLHNAMTGEANSRIWFLRTTVLFEDQSESLYQSADLQAKPIEFMRGDIISLAEDADRGIHVIEGGQVKLRSLTEGGKEIILDVLGPGDVFGSLDRALDQQPVARKPTPGMMPSEAVALSKGSALRYPMSYLHDLVQRRPTFVVNLTRILGLRQKRLELRLSRLLYRSSLGKVAGLLAELAERYGERKAQGGIELKMKLTHQEMASIVGLKRETVSEAMADLELRGLILAPRGKIVVLNAPGLDHIM